MRPGVLAEQIRNGFPAFDPNDADAIKAHQILSRCAIATCVPFHHNASGRGIVICSGGARYFTCAWVAVHMLRHVGCDLPVQFWHLDGEMDDRMRDIVAPLGVSCINANAIARALVQPPRILNGWELKPFSLLHSSFAEVLFLDADNVPVKDPTYLFQAPEYLDKGAIFWPDYSRLAPMRSIWGIAEVPYQDEAEFESGQIVLDKKKSWDALNLTMHYNEHSDFYFHHVHGDKETFHMAWRRLNQKYAMPSRGIESLAATMCQHDFEGNRIFQHRNMDKWQRDGSNPHVEGFLFEDECREALTQLGRLWDGLVSTD